MTRSIRVRITPIADDFSRCSRVPKWSDIRPLFWMTHTTAIRQTGATGWRSISRLDIEYPPHLRRGYGMWIYQRVTQPDCPLDRTPRDTGVRAVRPLFRDDGLLIRRGVVHGPRNDIAHDPSLGASPLGQRPWLAIIVSPSAC